MTLFRDVIELLGKIAPLHLAETWDNVGLLMGDPPTNIRHLMTCLTITPEVVAEAVKEKAELIVTHHPLLFKPTQRITSENVEGRMLLKLAAAGISVYSPHTAYDNAPDGINDQLAALLKLEEIRPLVSAMPKSPYKVVVFVPEQDLAPVSDAAFQAGAGIIGNYEQCSYRSSGTGTFFGNQNANPTIGKTGRREEVAEYRLELFCSSARLSAVLHAIHHTHSYETPAMDVYPLHPQTSSASSYEGTGRIGQLPAPLTSQALADQVSQLLQTPVNLTGDRHLIQISSVAIVCGAGGSLLSQAIKADADAFLTGEIRFHDELAAQAAGVTVLAAGHYATERPGMEALARRLASNLPHCKVWASCAEQNPSQWVPSPTKPRSG
ncbi:MAG TPA: Nif3-like dinuclear metal center hexameric protein [Gemmatales bacterium]|nr:Nif3-like dinuclear metal center hexameric protein [Gemmatales bacterium]